jgi:hypothetical protein
MTLAGNTVCPYGSIDTNFDPPQFSLGSTFKSQKFSKKFEVKFSEPDPLARED